MLFEIDNVELYFKSKRILSGIYLRAETGQVTAILGKNGCGKSCLLDIIFGDITPKYRLIRLDGKPILKPLYKTGFVKYLPQDSAVLPTLKLNTILRIFNLDWLKFSEVFPEFSQYRNTKFKKLSGGEQRIFEIYLILKSASKVVLLDEPFNGIAPLMIERIQNIISEEKQQKIIILTDHRYQEVIEISDKIYLLHQGSTTEIKNVSQLEDYRYLNYESLIN